MPLQAASFNHSRTSVQSASPQFARHGQHNLYTLKYSHAQISAAPASPASMTAMHSPTERPAPMASARHPCTRRCRRSSVTRFSTAQRISLSAFFCENCALQAADPGTYLGQKRRAMRHHLLADQEQSLWQNTRRAQNVRKSCMDGIKRGRWMLRADAECTASTPARH